MSDTLFNAMNISAAGMSAQRSRLDIVAQNIANAESTRTEQGGPYRRRQVVFRSSDIKPGFDSVFQSSFDSKAPKGVKVESIIEDNRPFREVYNPGHPDADARGMVKMSNVNPVEEMVDMQSASRGFEANVTTMEAAKRMFQKSLELLR